MKLKTLIISNKLRFDSKFKKLLKKRLDNSTLSKAIYYGSNNGGKRIRPFLVNKASKIAKINPHNCFILSASIECIHSYSLIHDDLPCMDDDDFRRGKLSTHKKFDEATAILAGDALHDIAFELMSSELRNINLKSNISLINYLSVCLGHKGLALGQALDLEFENKKIGKNKILSMYLNKTGKLFEFSKIQKAFQFYLNTCLGFYFYLFFYFQILNPKLGLGQDLYAQDIQINNLLN